MQYIGNRRKINNINIQVLGKKKIEEKVEEEEIEEDKVEE